MPLLLIALLITLWYLPWPWWLVVLLGFLGFCYCLLMAD